MAVVLMRQTQSMRVPFWRHFWHVVFADALLFDDAPPTNADLPGRDSVGLDDSALSSPPSSPHHLHNERRHLDTALAGAALEPPHSLCHPRSLDRLDPESRPSSLSCSGKKAVSNNLPTSCRPTTMPTSLPILLTIFLEPPVS
ncbi:hypothetical protein KCU93_g38, partial [Aureobasidium melanogenum]